LADPENAQIGNRKGGPMSIQPSAMDSAAPNTCPRWCVTHHGIQLGEEDWIHTSEPVPVAEGLVARLCMSIDPDTGIQDGPHVLIGTSECTLSETAVLGGSLLALVDDAQDA
jgi:hypothetical protein